MFFSSRSFQNLLVAKSLGGIVAAKLFHDQHGVPVGKSTA